MGTTEMGGRSKEGSGAAGETVSFGHTKVVVGED